MLNIPYQQKMSQLKYFGEFELFQRGAQSIVNNTNSDLQSIRLTSTESSVVKFIRFNTGGCK